MTPSDRSAFTQLLTDVLGFYGQATTPFALSVWWEACRSMELADIRAAMTAHATDPTRGHFAPKPADLIRIVRGTSGDRALEAWAHVLGQVRSVGSYGRPELDARQREALDGIGGWSVLCRSDESELPFLQRRYVEQFQTAEAREQRLALPGGAVPLKLA